MAETFENANETVQGVQAGGKDVVLDVEPGTKSLPQQAQQAKDTQAAALPDTGERGAAITALSLQYGPDFTKEWLADPLSQETQAASYKILEQHFGPGYLENIDLGRQVLADFATPGLRKALETSGLGNSPDVGIFLAGIGVALKQAREEAKQAQRPAGEVTPPITRCWAG